MYRSQNDKLQVSRISLLRRTEVSEEVAECQNVSDLVCIVVIFIKTFILILLDVINKSVFDVDQFVLWDDADFLDNILESVVFVQYVDTLDSEDAAKEWIYMQVTTLYSLVRCA